MYYVANMRLLQNFCGRYFGQYNANAVWSIFGRVRYLPLAYGLTWVGARDTCVSKNVLWLA